jgi:hypothetical protein
MLKLMCFAKWRLMAGALGGILAGQQAHADLISDSHATLDLRNLYFDRDFRQPGGGSGDGNSQAREWGQGLMLRLQSGYTEGTIGLGMDAIGMLGLKLDSGGGRGATGLFPTQADGSSPNEYSKLGLTAKAKVSKTIFKAGALMFRNTVLQSPDSRLLPQMFRGTMVESQEVAGLSLQAARITSVVGVDSANWEKLRSRFGGESDKFVLLGGDYKLSELSTVGLHHGKLDGIYKQDIINFGNTLPLTRNQSIKTDIRLAKSSEDGDFRPIDNKAVGIMSTYRIGAHGLGLGYQKMMGDDAYPYVINSDPYLVNFIQVLPFANAGERSLQVRYDFDFAAWGVPGLSFMTRYVKGDQIKLAQQGEGREWERNSEITYVLQSGRLKDLSLKWRNATVRSTFGNDLDENRIIVSYPLQIF